MSKSIIDLFCGCGGFSLSAIRAGFSVTTSVDIDPILTSSYPLNFPNANLLLTNIEQLTGKQLIKANGGVPAGIIGGPPCQGFSVIGRKRKADRRNELLFHFFRIVKEVRPAFFVMENVPGLLSLDADGYLDRGLDLVSQAYTILDPELINAAECGAATTRTRVVVVGFDPSRCDEPASRSRRKPVSLRNAIGDLPTQRMRQVEADNHVFGRYRAGDMSAYMREMRALPPPLLGSQLSIDLMKRGFVSGCGFTAHTKSVKKRFAKLRQGETDPISRYPKLEWDSPANTLRAGTGKEGGSFQAARPIHPFQDRVITVREAARIQGFPDWFLFHPTIWHSFRMIGNSVAPRMGTSVLSSLLDCVDIDFRVAA